MKIKFILTIILSFFLLNPIALFSQIDSSKINPDKLILKPSFYGIQLEAITSIVSSELGFIVDYDIYSSTNKKHNLGLRVSTEYYDFISLDVGGKSAPGPFIDFNIYGRHSIRGAHFLFSPIAGISFHNSLENKSKELTLLFKWGFELKYNLYRDNIGLLLKFIFSFIDDAGYAGIGLAFKI